MEAAILGQIIEVLKRIGKSTDAADAAGSLHAKVGDLKNTVTLGVRLKQAVASSTLRLSANTQRSTTSTTYVLMKNIAVFTPGTYRVSFYLSSSSSGTDVSAYARIYINGAPVGTERSITGGGGITFTEDIAANAGDNIQLWVRSTSPSYTTYVSNFKIYFDYASTLSDGVVLSD